MTEIKPYNPDWFPPCFNSKEQFNEYMFLVRKIRQPMDPNNYCLDCTREYKIQMLKEKRCEHSETIFVRWRNTYKPSETTSKVSSAQDKHDVLGVSNISQFWNNLTYD